MSNQRCDSPRPQSSRSSSSSDCEYLDATGEIELGEGASRFKMDLHTSLEHCMNAMNKFLNNDLEGAMTIIRPWNRSSLYHSLGTSIFEFIPAVLTLDPKQVDVALASIKSTLSLCQRHRRSYSFVETLGAIIKKPNFSTYTEIEAHAELCYAETLLLQAALSLLEGEDLTGLVRASLRIKSSHNSYKDCAKLLAQRHWESERSKRDFESGVRLGLAAFSVLISMLPPRMVTLLSYAGFSGDRAAGLAELVQGSRAGGLRGPLCDITLLIVHLIVCHFVGAKSDLILSKQLLARRLQQYPDGAWFLLFLGRSQLLQGQVEYALDTYTQASTIPRLWPQFRNITYWECMWAFAIDLRWRDAAQMAQMLLEHSSWSRTIYSYMRAAFILQLGEDATSSEKRHAVELLGTAGNYTQRFAGKSVPMEKFIVRRCSRWSVEGQLYLPGLEMLSLWNMFQPLVLNSTRAKRALRMIVTAFDEADMAASGQGRPMYHADNRALLLYLRGDLHCAMGEYRRAAPYLTEVIEMKHEINYDTFLVPYALFDMAVYYLSIGLVDRGQSMLKDIRRNFSGYLLESRLHFRIHARLHNSTEPQNAREAAERQALLDATRRATRRPRSLNLSPPPPYSESASSI